MTESLLTSHSDSYEYRVFAAYRTYKGEVVVSRPENPFYDREQAERFAERFTPPKFKRAWVECRRVSAWEAAS
jgi:hypothetical protein